ncbi:DUF2769 domain-containing protein [Methanolobus sp.]|uniref:DUF2769 domain-containing protein n=1 Tax=Methanolobus sp. TaxID=1874737 RepID=UPI0025F00C17|nr:DUF2769 domain-containing protein [Methanolobus sp.]
MDNDGSLKVPYIKGNIERCMCSECPVQADSKCAQDKLERSKKIMANMSGDDVPDPKEVPGVYCSTGKARCSDLKPDEKCICNTCDVWKEYDLKNSTPSMYFCQNGQAKE